MRKSSCKVWGYGIKHTSPMRCIRTWTNWSLHLQRPTWGFSLCTRLMQFEPYTTVFSGTTSHVLIWQHAPTMQPLVSITFLPRSAAIERAKSWILDELSILFMHQSLFPHTTVCNIQNQIAVLLHCVCVFYMWVCACIIVTFEISKRQPWLPGYFIKIQSRTHHRNAST